MNTVIAAVTAVLMMNNLPSGTSVLTTSAPLATNQVVATSPLSRTERVVPDMENMERLSQSVLDSVSDFIESVQDQDVFAAKRARLNLFHNLDDLLTEKQDRLYVRGVLYGTCLSTLWQLWGTYSLNLVDHYCAFDLEIDDESTETLPAPPLAVPPLESPYGDTE